MKNLYVLLMVIVMIIVTHAARAQAPVKPSQFSAYPENIGCTEAQLTALFAQPANTPIVVSLTGGFLFKGTLQSNEQPYTNLQTIIIRSTNFPGSVFSLSKRTENGTVEYVGRILSFQHGDAFELQHRDGAYTLQKKKFDHLIQTCHQ